jgi:hypothetical protein
MNSMSTTPKQFCKECEHEVSISDRKCESCGAYPLRSLCKYFVEVTYSSNYYFFKRASELVALPEINFTSMKEKEAWFVKAKAVLRLKHFGEDIPSPYELNRTAKIRTYMATTMYNIIKSMVSKK